MELKGLDVTSDTSWAVFYYHFITHRWIVVTDGHPIFVVYMHRFAGIIFAATELTIVTDGCSFEKFQEI